MLSLPSKNDDALGSSDGDSNAVVYTDKDVCKRGQRGTRVGNGISDVADHSTDTSPWRELCSRKAPEEQINTERRKGHH